MSEWRDIEQERRQQDDLQSATDRLKVLSRLAATLAHEIHNPLTTIFLHVDILEDALQQLAKPESAQLLRFLRVLREDVRRVENLVQQYLWLARLPDLQRQPEDLGGYLEVFALEIRGMLAARGVTLQLEGTRDLGSLALHKQTFRRVLLDLCHQAMEAMPQGGTLRLRGQCLGHYLRLEISDTGCGIPAAHLPRVFDPLYTAAPDKPGHGLYIVQAIVAAHQGEIMVASEPGRGTTVTMTFPAGDNPPPAGRAASRGRATTHGQ